MSKKDNDVLDERVSSLEQAVLSMQNKIRELEAKSANPGCPVKVCPGAYPVYPISGPIVWSSTGTADVDQYSGEKISCTTGDTATVCGDKSTAYGDTVSVDLVFGTKYRG